MEGDELLKARMRAYRERPDVKARTRAYKRAYSQRPDVKARTRAYQQNWRTSRTHGTGNVKLAGEGHATQ